MPFGRGTGGRSERTPPEPPDPEDRTAAEAAALRILQGATQSESGMQRRLKRRGFSDDTALEVTGRLVAGGWIDDARLAQSLADRRRDRGFGRARIAADLASRGITDDETVSAALNAEDPEAELNSARDAGARLRGRYPAGRLAPPEMRRFAAALQRRGFNHGVVRTVLREIDVADQQRAELDDGVG